MDYEGLRTYEGWLMDERRAVKSGEKALFYLIAPDGQRRRALFAAHQTYPHERPDVVEGWTTVVPASEVPTLKRKPKAILHYTTENQELRVWVGPNKRVIARLQKNGFQYLPAEHKWLAKRADIDASIEGIEHYGCRVEAYVDGASYTPPATTESGPAI